MTPCFINRYKGDNGSIVEETRGPDGELIRVDVTYASNGPPSNPPSNPLNSYSVFGWPGLGSWVNPTVPQPTPTQPGTGAACDDSGPIIEAPKTQPTLPKCEDVEEEEVSTPCSCAFFSRQNGLPVSCDKCKKESPLDRRLNMYATLIKAANVLEEAGDLKLADALRAYAGTITTWHL